MNLDLNCDLGEREPLSRTRALMRCITSANVACGGHAGTVESMEACARLAKQFHVCLGAHPGPWNRGNFGRGAVSLTARELELLLVQQTGALERIARVHGLSLHHIKLHGALYHATETDPRLAACYLSSVKRWWPRAKVYALAGGTVADHARRIGVAVWEEAFADRSYAENGSLVSRADPEAVITSLARIRSRVQTLLERGQIQTVTGSWLQFETQTLCVHSDTPRALEIAKYIARILRKGAGYRQGSGQAG